MTRLYCILQVAGKHSFVILCTPNKVIHEPHAKDTSKRAFCASFICPGKKKTFGSISLFSTTVKYVLFNPESVLFSETKNGYGRNVTTYHTNHLVKNHEKWFWSFNQFPDTMVSWNLN